MSSLTFIQLETFSFISEIRDVEGLAREKLNKVQNNGFYFLFHNVNVS